MASRSERLQLRAKAEAASFSDDMTIADARAALRGLVEEGHDCPVCTQHARVYRRPLTSVAARAIEALWLAHQGQPGHLPTVARERLADVATQGGYLTLGQHWGLIAEASPEVRQDGGRAGYWRVTGLGEAWLHGRARVQSHARLYNGRCLGLTGRPVTFEDVRGEPFKRTAITTSAADAADAEPLELFTAEQRQRSTDSMYGADAA